MVDATADKMLAVVLLFVESYHSRYVEFLENLHILFWMVTIALLLVTLLDGPHERHKLAGYNPVDVAVLDSLMELVLLHVECLVIVPPELNCVLKALEALEQRALVEAVPLAGVAVCLEEGCV